MIVVVVETDLAPSDDFGMLRQPGQLSQMLLRYFLRFVGMNADSGVNPIMLFGKWQGGIEFLRTWTSADSEERRHACRARRFRLLRGSRRGRVGLRGRRTRLRSCRWIRRHGACAARD